MEQPVHAVSVAPIPLGGEGMHAHHHHMVPMPPGLWTLSHQMLLSQPPPQPIAPMHAPAALLVPAWPLHPMMSAVHPPVFWPPMELPPTVPSTTAEAQHHQSQLQHLQHLQHMQIQQQQLQRLHQQQQQQQHHHQQQQQQQPQPHDAVGIAPHPAYYRRLQQTRLQRGPFDFIDMLMPGSYHREHHVYRRRARHMHHLHQHRNQRVADQKIAQMPVRKFVPPVKTASDYTPESCSVCLEEYDEGVEIMTLSCQHEFHKTCLERWLRKKLTCPLCRSAV